MSIDPRIRTMLEALPVLEEEVDPQKVLWDKDYKDYAWNHLARIGYRIDELPRDKIIEETVKKPMEDMYIYIYKDILGRYWIYKEWWDGYTHYYLIPPDMTNQVLNTPDEESEGTFNKISALDRNHPRVKTVEIDVFDTYRGITSVRDARESLEKILGQLEINKTVLSQKYAYKILFPDDPSLQSYPQLTIIYSGDPDQVTELGIEVHEKLDELIKRYEEYARSLRDALWESIQYLNYLYEKEVYNKPKEIILDFYKKVQDFLEIEVIPSEDMYKIWIYCPSVMKGYLIGRNGNTVKKLKEKIEKELGKRVKIKLEDSLELTEKYQKKHGLKIPEKAMPLVSKVLADLKILKDRYGIYPRYLEKLLFELEEGKYVKTEEEVD